MVYLPVIQLKWWMVVAYQKHAVYKSVETRNCKKLSNNYILTLGFGVKNDGKMPTGYDTKKSLSSKSQQRT